MVWDEGIPPHPLFASSLLQEEGSSASLTEHLLEALTSNLQAEAAWLEGKIQTVTADPDPKTQNAPFYGRTGLSTQGVAKAAEP